MASSLAVADTHGINIPSRYEIRKIGPEATEWCKALAIYGFLRTSIWTPILREPKMANALKALTNLSDYYNHSIKSGISYGVFDTEYRFTRPEPSSTGGALYWHELDSADPDLHRKMIDAMDFPLVSLALSFDCYDQRTADFEEPLLEILPLHPFLMAELGKGDKRPAESWLPRALGEVVCRCGTITKPGYENRGLMTALNSFLMLELKAQGFRGIFIGIAGTPVYRVYTKPPAGCKSVVLHHFNVEEIELEDHERNKYKPYIDCGLKEGWLVWCDLELGTITQAANSRIRKSGSPLQIK
ncbi:hypothetical protein BJ170DRAFT_724751 [Xylariales sp. AK1849]|nr:hypothetical protein BJ170DRAFT_724751 [Xylariales sp. AK1849]